MFRRLSLHSIVGKYCDAFHPGWQLVTMTVLGPGGLREPLETLVIRPPASPPGGGGRGLAAEDGPGRDLVDQDLELDAEGDQDEVGDLRD